MTLPANQPISDLNFIMPDGTTLKLSDFERQPVVLIFLRHLA
jgi:peroxiredoxin